MLVRIGGILIHPRTTLRTLLGGQGGSMFDILPWCLAVACLLSPNRTGQALLYMRVDIAEGIRILISLLTSQMTQPLVGAALAALILAAIARFRVDKSDSAKESNAWTFDRCLDACMYMLVPYLVITTISVILEQSGVRNSFLPHRPFRGQGIYLFLRLALAFGWSFCLYLYVLRSLIQGTQLGEKETA